MRTWMKLVLFIGLVGLLGFPLVSSSKLRGGPTQIKLGDLNTAYPAGTWRLIPRTQPRPRNLANPLDIKPDDYFRFIPSYIGSVLPGQTLSWNSTCFQTNVATLQTTANSVLVNVEAHDKANLLCDDVYLFGYVAGLDIRAFEISGNHQVEFRGPWPTEEAYDLKNLGIRIFRFPDSVTGSTAEIWETLMLFAGALIGAHVPDWTAEDNLKFMYDHMNGYTMPERTTQVVNISKSDVHSGDFLGIIRLDGLDPMLAWAMGSHTGHTAIAMWIDNELYVLESTVSSNYWPTNGIQKTTWDKWIPQAIDANYNVVLLPLSPASRAKFSEQQAIAFFNSVEGLPYGFHNMFTGWIDTAEDNYPGALSSHLTMLIAPFLHWLLNVEIGEGPTFDFFGQTVNQRLGTDLSLPLNQAYMQMGQRGMNFTQMATMPEMDEWIYDWNNNQTGPSMVCDVLVSRVWKAGGLFGSIANKIQATEFTNWDAYSLNFFDGNYQRPQACVEADPSLPYCQILGKYRMTINNYNTFAPFPHMRQTCPTKAPLYIKPANC